ncbi:excisionase [Duganella levis]|uniref:excisionase n=1 Tax=Duganella levis TaxID=2692169 RepID=UPI0019261DF6|nr:excisionase [Duganella levis]
MNHPIAWVKIKKYEELTGDTAASVHARRRAGKWRDGVQCKVVDEMLWVNLPAAEKWVETWGQGIAARG